MQWGLTYKYYSLICGYNSTGEKITVVIYIKDLEKRCKLANFAPYDDRVPNQNYEFKWDSHTISIAEEWLKKHN